VSLADGRVLRGERNKEAIAAALLQCYDEGILRPSAAEVAQRAGVSVRSVHNHFEDMEALRAAVAVRQWARFENVVEAPSPEGTLAKRIATIVRNRAELWEGVTPVRRAALLIVHESPTIAETFARIDRRMRRVIDITFERELQDAMPEIIEAIDAALSWDNWNRLRSSQGCSVTRARRVLTVTLEVLLGGGKS
jgi:AcrR family transcriptional regulator